MTNLQFLNRSISDSDALEALSQTLRQQYAGKVSGISTNLTGVFIVFEDSATSDDIQAALAAALAFDLSTRTAEQLARAQAIADFQQLVDNNAQTMLSQLQAGEAACDSDIELLNGTPSNAQVVQALVRAVTRQKQELQGLERVVKSYALIRKAIGQ
jgi:hypothetical protein